eukprot:Tamp_04695.p1 GENE.Tamp_04695~~Tamp_04695.p1  ORF type:complete len:461 (-),score=95.02 Tamp_04695:1816-3162(-)
MGDITFAQVPRADFNRRWIDSRRAGGGGGDPIAKPLAVLMLMLAGLAVIAKFLKQSNLSASLLAGIIFGFAELNERYDTRLGGEVIKTFTEFGMTFVLFFAGLSININEIYLKRMVPVAFWFMLLSGGFAAAVAYGAGLVETTSGITMFGLACAMCSKNLLYEYLEDEGEERSMHGMAMMCVSWFQDIVLLVCLAVVHAYKNSLVGMDTTERRAEPNTSAGSRRAVDLDKFGPTWPPQFNVYALGDNIGIALATLALVMLLHWILKKYFLKRAFRFFCQEGELLFFGVMAYSLGTCALCFEANFSPVVSAYLSGFAISKLPSRVQVQQKISSLRAFGIFLFHFMLGIYVKLDAHFFETDFPWALLLSCLIVVVNPIFMFVLGRFWCILPRTSIYLAMLSNNVGEHALILASLAYQAGIFEFRILQILVCACIPEFDINAHCDNCDRRK